MLTIAHEFTLPNPRRGWATLTSFTLQATAVTVVLLIPLLQPSLLPNLNLTPHLVPIFLPHVEAPAVRSPSSASVSASPRTNVFTVPREVPKTIALGPDTAAPPEAEAPCAKCVGVAVPETGVPGGVTILGLAVPPALPKPARPVRVSVMMDGYLVHRVQPDYPELAKRARIQGPVEIAALISKQGTIENLQILKGHPMLVGAALNAVKQWRYRPYVLNGDPIEVDTKISVIFSLGN